MSGVRHLWMQRKKKVVCHCSHAQTIYRSLLMATKVIDVMFSLSDAPHSQRDAHHGIEIEHENAYVCSFGNQTAPRAFAS